MNSDDNANNGYKKGTEKGYKKIFLVKLRTSLNTKYKNQICW